MKKRVLSIFLACALTVGCFAVNPTEAKAAVDTNISNAIECSYDTEYAGTNKLYKLTVPENGVVGISANKQLEDENYNPAMVRVYNQNGEVIWYTPSTASEVSTLNVKVGLAAGTYFVSVEHIREDFFSNVKFTYEKKYCEIESNGTKATATPLELGAKITGYMGNDSGTEKGTDYNDFYVVNLTKGQSYVLCSSSTLGSTVTVILGKDAPEDQMFASEELNDYCVDFGNEFVAPYTGAYYVRVCNYFGEQFEYEISVDKATLSPITLKSVKASKNSIKVNWKKGKAIDGYKIQYSTNKNFKNAKTIKVPAKQTSKIINNLSSNKKYYVRICGYRRVFAEKDSCLKWSKVKTVKVK